MLTSVEDKDPWPSTCPVFEALRSFQGISAFHFNALIDICAMY